VPVRAPLRPRNDPRQYDDLVDEWWRPRGAFSMLHWIAEARASLVPPPARPGALLLDVACGGGLLAPHLPAGYRHVGVDLSATALRVARDQGVDVVRGDVTRLPLHDGAADVVVAGEVLEHVARPDVVIAECARVLRPGGLLVIDTIADTWLARLLVVTIAERIPGGAPKHIHDPALFVNRRALVAAGAAAGVPLRLTGLRPSVRRTLRWLARRADRSRMVPTWSTAVLFQGVGEKVST
jgi:2-polyprenyl-6-hydroxyphenyl methylase/3-demethylubiquinone-9 3-methyltransferase